MLLIAVGTAFDVLTPPEVSAAPLFTAAPLIAAPFFSLAVTLVTGLAAVVAVTLLLIFHGSSARVESITELVTTITVVALALLTNRVVRRSGEQLASARVIAETVQRAVLPPPADRIGGLRVAARYVAAHEDAFIGGDLFAVQETPYGVRLVVGDVRGKGLQAVEAVAVVIGAFREAAEQERTLEAVAGRLERALVREAERRSGLDAVEGFTTAVLAEVRPDRDVVRLVNRGHPEPLMLYADGSVGVLAPRERALPLGMAALGMWPDRAEETELPPGATLLFYTDGLSEARDATGTFYDPRARLEGRVFPGPGGLLDELVDDVRRYTGDGSTDDMALLAVGRPVERAGHGSVSRGGQPGPGGG
ncbi:PP2C family protein-serine/threonine phosphatase [Streptomyces sannanensis]